MNIDTATTAIFGSNGISNSTSSIKRSSDKNSSFQDELKTTETDDTQEVKQTEKEAEPEKVTRKQDEKKSDKKDDKKVSNEKKEQEVTQKNAETEDGDSNTLKGELSMSDMSKINSEDFSMLSDKVKSFIMQNGGQFDLNSFNLMAATTREQIANIAPAVDYSSIKMSDTDAKFFSDLVNKTNMSSQSIATEFQKMLDSGSVQQAQSTAKATAALIENLKESAKTNQPFRIDFDKDISVILKVGKDGSINANFIPGDKAVENYLRNNIDFLKQRFNEENIAYGDLNYSKSRQEKEKQNKNNKEQNNE